MDTSDSGFEDRILEALVATQILGVLTAAITDLGPGDFDLMTTVIVATLAGITLAPFTNAEHVRIHRLRRRLTAHLAERLPEAAN